MIFLKMAAGVLHALWIVVVLFFAMASKNGHDDVFARAEAVNLERIAELEAELEIVKAKLVAAETSKALKKVEPTRSTMTDGEKSRWLRRQMDFHGLTYQEAAAKYFKIPWE
jgi:hypothetical protein